MKVLLTGAAGFIGAHVAQALLNRGVPVVGIDNLNAYYDPGLKRARLKALCDAPGFELIELDIGVPDALTSAVCTHQDVTHVVHLAAQAGVRHSMVDPYAYVHTNMQGQVAVLECARRLPKLQHVVYASSSSVYGRNRSLPFRESDPVDVPGSFYAVSKRAAELTSESYAHLFGLPQTGLRFFTVYGPWGRPDMAYYGFAHAIAAGEPVTLYAGSELARDFTYIDDVVGAVLGILDRPPEAGVARLLNVGNDSPCTVRHLIGLLARELGQDALITDVPRPGSDMLRTWAAVEDIRAISGWMPAMPFEEGIARFVAWFRAYEGL